MECLEIQRTKFESATGPHQKARMLMDLVLLSLYVQLPPSRCLEIRSLRLWRQQTKPFDNTLVKSNHWNVLLLSESGQITLHFHTYKTKKSRGSDITEIQVWTTFTGQNTFRSIAHNTIMQCVLTCTVVHHVAQNVAEVELIALQGWAHALSLCHMFAAKVALHVMVPYMFYFLLCISGRQ